MSKRTKTLTAKGVTITSGSGVAGVGCWGGQVLCWEIIYVHYVKPVSNPRVPLTAYPWCCSTGSPFTGDSVRAVGCRDSAIPEQLARAGALSKQDKENASDRLEQSYNYNYNKRVLEDIVAEG